MNTPEISNRNKLVAPKVFEKRQRQLTKNKANRPYKIFFLLLGGFLFLFISSLAVLRFYNYYTIAKMTDEAKHLTHKNYAPPQTNNSNLTDDEKAKIYLSEKSTPENRRKYAFGLEVSIDESKATIKNVRIETEGMNNDVLVITGDGITAQDCSSLAFSDYGQTASAIGFVRITCRNRISQGEWSLGL